MVTYALTGLKFSESNDTETTTYVYDALGRKTQESTGETIRSYGYNICNQLVGTSLDDVAASENTCR